MSIPNTQIFAVQVQFTGGLPAAGPNAYSSINMGNGVINQPSWAPTFVYNVTDLAGNPLGTNMTPTKPGRGYLTSQGGGIGMGYYDESSTFVLYDAGEQQRPQDSQH